MFDLKRPCKNCPFRVSQAANFALHPARLEEIRTATAFQCHATVNYAAYDDEGERQGDHPQQCAGLMAVLGAIGKPNQIMQVAYRLGAFDPDRLDTRDTFTTWDAVLAEHERHARPRTRP